MNVTRMLQVTLLLFGVLCVAGRTIAQVVAVPDAERAAKIYMTAFFHGDLQTAASLTHPETLDSIRSSLLGDLAKTNDKTGKPVTPADFGLELSLDEIHKLSAEAIYVAMLEADHKRDPAMFEAMKQTQVEVLSSQITPDGKAIVRLKIITPTRTSTSSQDSGLMLRLSNSQWKVLGNAQ
jgi:hypothetical protein